MRTSATVFRGSSWKRAKFSEGHMLAYIGAAAAYMHGEEWLEQLLDYIKGNIDFTRTTCANC